MKFVRGVSISRLEKLTLITQVVFELKISFPQVRKVIRIKMSRDIFFLFYFIAFQQR